MGEHDDLLSRLRSFGDEFAVLDRELTQAVADGALDVAGELRARRDRVGRQRDRLLDRLTGPPPGATAAGEPPLREQALDVLRRIGRPLDTRQITGLVWARAGHPVSPAQLSAVRRDDERSYRRRPRGRPEYVVPGLVAGRWTPVRGTLASSAWPFADRLIVGRTARAAFLEALIAVIDETRRLDGLPAERHRRLAETWSRDLLVVPAASAEPLAAWRAAAQLELDELSASERDTRMRAAAQAPELSPADQLWGHALRLVRETEEGR